MDAVSVCVYSDGREGLLLGICMPIAVLLCKMQYEEMDNAYIADLGL